MTNQSGKYLANQIKQKKKRKSTITIIKDWKPIYLPEEITKILETYGNL